MDALRYGESPPDFQSWDYGVSFGISISKLIRCMDLLPRWDGALIGTGGALAHSPVILHTYVGFHSHPR